MPKIIELRQDRNLICNNFDGYKLSLDPIPLFRKDLEITSYRAERCENEQYSLLHAELFTLQNLLQVDPWARNHCYFMNRLGQVMSSCYNETSGRPQDLVVVYQLDRSDENPLSNHKKGDYNFSMRFISEKFCVLCDGKHQLYLFDTKDREKNTEWVLVATTDITSEVEEPIIKNYTIYDSRLDVVNEQKEISLALGQVVRIDEQDGLKSHHELHIIWAKWVAMDGDWKLNILDTLEGKGSLYYCAFEPRAQSLILSSNHSYEFRSQKGVRKLEDEQNESNSAKLHDESHADTFTWSQTDADLSIKFNTKPENCNTDYNVRCTSDRLTIKCVDETLLDNVLFSKIEKDLTTWTVENNFLQVTIMKQSDVVWPYLFADGRGPKESVNDGGSNNISNEQKPIVNLEAPIEDCDFPIGIDEDEIKIERFNLSSKSVTHAVLLGPQPPLFSTQLRPGYASAIVTRQDTDACIWLQQYNPNRPDEWSLRHEGNLNAFAYVQASKTQKKFLDCAPDLSYAIIVESYRHVFVYKGKNASASSLRNRTGKSINIGKQQLVTLDDVGEILGVVTSNSSVAILTEKCLLYLQISE